MPDAIDLSTIDHIEKAFVYLRGTGSPYEFVAPYNQYRNKFEGLLR